MKKIISYVLIAIVAASAAGCSSKPETQNGWETMNLHGDVKSLLSVAYEPMEAPGGVMMGAPLNYAQSHFYYEFNKDGFVTRNEWYLYDSVTSWDEYYYGADGKLEKIFSKSVYYDGETSIEVDWINATDYVRRTYDENHEMMMEEDVKASKDKIHSIVNGAGGEQDTEYITYFKNGRVARVENKSDDSVASMEYEYNDKGDEVSLVTYMDGELFGKLSFEYLEYDKNDNWIKRVVYEQYEDGDGIPVEFTQRTIEYYK